MEKTVRRLRDQADRFRLKGLHDKALQAYLDLARLEPENPRWRHLAGEQQRRLGRRQEAAASFVDAAELYLKRGMGVQALALAKLALECVPGQDGAKAVLRRLARSTEETVATMARQNLPSVELRALDREAGGGGGRKSQTLDGLSLRQVLGSSQELPAVQEEATPGDVAARARAVAQAETEASIVRAVSAFEIPILDHELSLATPTAEPSHGTDVGLARPMARPTDEQVLAAKRTPLFGELDPASLDTLVGDMKVLEVSEGAYVVRQGEPGSALYVVASGRLEALRRTPDRPEPVLVGTLGPGDFFGEISLVTALPRQASVRAVTAATLLEIDQELVVRLIQEHPTVVRVLLRFFMRRMVDILLRTSPVFRDLDETLQASFLEDFRFLEVEPGVRFIVQGRPIPGLFVLLAGKARVVVVDRSGSRVLAELGPGDVVGETALLAGRRAVTNVETTAKCWMVFMPAKAFREKAILVPEVVRYLTRLWKERLAAAGARPEDQPVFPVEHLELV